MITGYAIDAEAYCIPLHLNIVFNSGCDFNRDYPEDSLIVEILEFAKASPYKYFLIEMKRVRSVGYIFDKLGAEFISGSKVLIFYKSSEIIKEKLLNDFSSYFAPSSTTAEALSSPAGMGYYLTVLNPKNDLDNMLKMKKICMVGDLLKGGATFKKEYLESSNVYANSYLNVKLLFSEAAMFRLVVYELCCNISDFFSQADAILCVSNNGAAISAVIGKMIRKPVIYLMNLGPHITIKDAKVIDKICHGNKLIFVYDFICLGTEFKIARMVAKIRGAEVLGGTGVACHLEVPNVANYPFMKVDAEYKFGYKIYLYPEGI